MFSYLKLSPGFCALVSLLQIAEWGLQTLVQILLVQIFSAATQFDWQGFVMWTVIDITAWAAYYVICALQGYAQNRLVQRLNNQVRADIFRRLSSQPIDDARKNGSAEPLTELTYNINQLEALAWNPVFDGVGRIAQVVFSMIALAYYHWSLLLAALAAAFIMWAVPRVFSPLMQRIGQASAAAQAEATGGLQDILAGFSVFFVFNRLAHFEDKGNEISRRLEQKLCRFRSTKNAVECLCGFASVCLQILADVLVVVLAFYGKVSPALLAGGGNLIAGVTNGLNSFASLRLSIAASKPYFNRITASAEAQQPPTPPMPALQNAITVENVCFRYDEKKPILVNMNAQFKKGGKYALTGPSGCGKSTLLKIILGWLPGYEGRVCFDGADTRSFTPEQLQQQVSYIEQNVFLFNTTIRENITLGENFTDEQMEKALRASALAGDLANMPDGLDTPVGEEGSSLSGGQKQRVAIARALIHGRSILLVDEGTSALDAKNADIVEKSLLSNPDLTLILISHHLSEERKAQFDHVYELQTVGA